MNPIEYDSRFIVPAMADEKTSQKLSMAKLYGI